MKTNLSRSQAETEQLNQSQSEETSIVTGLSLRFCFRLRQSGFHLIVSDGAAIKRKRSDSFDSDSVAFMTPLKTPIFVFHSNISALTTTLSSPTTTLSA